MTAIISQVTQVESHPSPEKPHLGVFTLNGEFQLIGINNQDGSRRFNVGDLVVYIKPDSIIPQWIIDSGFQNLKGGKVKASNFAGVRSEGIMLNLQSDDNGKYIEVPDNRVYVTLGDDISLSVLQNT